MGPVQAQSSLDTAQALLGTPESCLREKKGPLLGFQAALACSANLLSDFKDNIVLCQRRKVACEDSIHS